MPNATNLDREVRRLRRMARVQTAGLGVLLAGLILGATSQPEELTLRQLYIVDAEGKKRIDIGTDSSGGATLTFRDRDGKMRMAVGAGSDGPTLALYDPDGTVRIVVATIPNGGAAVTVRGRDKTGSIALTTHPAGETGLFLMDRSGKERIMARVTSEDNKAELILFDPDNQDRIVGMTFPDGEATLGLLSRDGKVMWTQTSPP